MKIVKEKTAMIFFKKESQAINQFGFYILGCIQDIAKTKVPKDLFGKNEMEMIKVLNAEGKILTIPAEAIERIKYIS